MPLAPKTRLGRYEIRSKLGAGGMGEVYLAEDIGLERRVAIKFLPSALTADTHARKRLVREAKAASKLDHQNICSIYEVGEADGNAFIVMQYVEGETLESRIKRQPLELREVISLAAQIADALAEAHAHGIIHRDIKPSNIIITPRGQAKVLDFGLAKVEQGGVVADSAADTKSLLTTPGAIIGTVPYMSPEQVRGETVDARTDIFSFGVVLYEMLTGRQPFAAESNAAIASAILTKEPVPVARYVSECPEEMQRIVRKCLEKDRERRYQTMRDVATDLENVRRECEPVILTASRSQAEKVLMEAATQPSRPLPNIFPSRRRLMIAVPLALLVLTALAYAFFFRRATAPAPSEVKSLAVLPFKNIGGDAQDEYLSDGIADELIAKLTKLKTIRVVSLPIAMRYKNSPKDAAEIGRELGVDAVITGTVRKAGERLRVGVNLVSTADGFTMWADDGFDENVQNLLDAERQLAEAVATKLKGELTPQDRARVAKNSTASGEAYDLLLRGKDYYYKSRTSGLHGGGSDLRLAQQMFSRAIQLDSNFADGYAWLGLVLYDQFAGGNGSRATLDTAIDNENKALALDPDLIIARRALINIYHSTGQTEEGLKQGKRALETNPNDIDAVKGAALAYFRAGMMDKAIPLYQQALAADPADAETRNQLARSYLDAFQYQKGLDVLAPLLAQGEGGEWVGMQLYDRLQQYDQAIALGQRLLTRNADTLNWLTLGDIYQHAGQLGRARETWSQGAQYSEAQVSAFENERTRIWLGHLYAHLGERAEALDQIERALTLHGDDPWVLYQAGEISSLLGNNSEAINYLRRAIANGWLGLNYIIAQEQPGGSFFNLRDDPEYKSVRAALQKKVEALRAQY
jgi:serine/threonine protein kinase/tetratricopeptide (TPR) repeat protein